ncbi:cyclin-D1-binding protein 1 homolog [Ornithodoros turicata]
MAASSHQSSLAADHLKRLYDTLEVLCDQLKGRETTFRNTDNFNREEFWLKFNAVAKVVSHESSKLCMALAQPPAPTAEEQAALIAGLEKACLTFLSASTELPRSQGNTLCSEVADSAWGILKAVQNLLQVFIVMSTSHLQAVGTVWEKCSVIEHIPKDNKEAVSSILSGQYGIIQDATEELETAIRTDDTEAESGERIPVRNGFTQPRRSTWSMQDRQLLSPGLGLVKTARNTMRKVVAAVGSRGKCDTLEDNDELDKVADLVRMSSAYVDEFVMSLYPPVFTVAVRNNAEELKRHILSILDATRNSHFYDSSEEWVGFLESVVAHNYANLMECTARS